MTIPTGSWSPPTLGAEPPLASVPPPRRRRWPWVLAGSLGVVALTAVGALVLVGFDVTVQRHDLVSADFESGAGPFETGTLAQYRASVEDGTYVLTAADDPTGQTVSFAAFTRPAASVTVEATIADAGDEYGDNWFGVACLDSASSSALGYAFVVSGNGVALVRVSPEGGTMLAFDESLASWPSNGERLTITCTPSIAAGSVTVTGSISGEQVLSAMDADGIGLFRAAALVLRAYDRGDDLHIDDVTARVPGE